jgi:lathosterol oxidase
VLAFDCLVVGSAAMLGIMPHERVTWVSHVLTFLGFLVGFDIWFYVTHRFMHTKLMWRFHQVHHRAGTTSALTAFSFSLVERGILLVGSIGAACVAAQFVPVSEPGYLAYIVFNTAFNVVGHCNAELWPKWVGKSGIIGTSTYHAMHHDRGDMNYGLVFTFLDRMFGTMIADYQTRFDAVKAGKRL